MQLLMDGQDTRHDPHVLAMLAAEHADVLSFEREQRMNTATSKVHTHCTVAKQW